MKYIYLVSGYNMTHMCTSPDANAVHLHVQHMQSNNFDQLKDSMNILCKKKCLSLLIHVRVCVCVYVCFSRQKEPIKLSVKCGSDSTNSEMRVANLHGKNSGCPKMEGYEKCFCHTRWKVTRNASATHGVVCCSKREEHRLSKLIKLQYQKNSVGLSANKRNPATRQTQSNHNQPGRSSYFKAPKPC